MIAIGKASQRIIREREAREDPQLKEKQTRAAEIFHRSHGDTKEIPFETAKAFIERYEWMGDMGTTDISFGLYIGDELAAVECFGRTAGTNVAASVCGKDYAWTVKTLCRGACAYWAPKDAASYLITRTCNLMAERGFHIFVAYSDPEANEIGTVYQASDWIYCGTTTACSSKFRWTGKKISYCREFGTFKDGKARDERNIHHYIRRRVVSGVTDPYRIKCTRREMKERMVGEGFQFFKAPPKGRYVNFYGTEAELQELRAALQWEVLPYPTRDGSKRGVCLECGAVFPSNRQRRKHIAEAHEAVAA